MGSKFGGTEGSKNMWVTQQNLARHKSVLGYVHKHRPPKPKAAPPPKEIAPADAPVDGASVVSADERTE